MQVTLRDSEAAPPISQKAADAIRQRSLQAQLEELTYRHAAKRIGRAVRDIPPNVRLRRLLTQQDAEAAADQARIVEEFHDAARHRRDERSRGNTPGDAGGRGSGMERTPSGLGAVGLFAGLATPPKTADPEAASAGVGSGALPSVAEAAPEAAEAEPPAPAAAPSGEGEEGEEGEEGGGLFLTALLGATDEQLEEASHAAEEEAATVLQAYARGRRARHDAQAGANAWAAAAELAAAEAEAAAAEAEAEAAEAAASTAAEAATAEAAAAAEKAAAAVTVRETPLPDVPETEDVAEEVVEEVEEEVAEGVAEAAEPTSYRVNLTITELPGGGAACVAGIVPDGDATREDAGAVAAAAAAKAAKAEAAAAKAAAAKAAGATEAEATAKAKAVALAEAEFAEAEAAAASATAAAASKEATATAVAAREKATQLRAIVDALKRKGAEGAEEPMTATDYAQKLEAMGYGVDRLAAMEKEELMALAGRIGMPIELAELFMSRFAGMGASASAAAAPAGAPKEKRMTVAERKKQAAAAAAERQRQAEEEAAASGADVLARADAEREAREQEEAEEAAALAAAAEAEARAAAMAAELAATEYAARVKAEADERRKKLLRGAGYMGSVKLGGGALAAAEKLEEERAAARARGEYATHVRRVAQ